MSKSNIARNLLAEGGDELAQYYGWMAIALAKIRDNKELTSDERDRLKIHLPEMRFTQSKVEALLKSFGNSGGRRLSKANRKANRKTRRRQRNTRKV